MSTGYMSQTTALAAQVIFDQTVYMCSEKRGRAGYSDGFEDGRSANLPDNLAQENLTPLEWHAFITNDLQAGLGPIEIETISVGSAQAVQVKVSEASIYGLAEEDAPMSDSQPMQNLVVNRSMFPNASHFTINNSTFTVVSNDEREKIQKWLNAPDCATNFQTADDKRTEGTGQWILDHPEYNEWKQSPSLLWIQGKAGSGKTILTTTIIVDLKKEAPDNGWYHYFDSRDNTGQKSTFRGFLLSLLDWTGANSTSIHPALKTLFDQCNRQGLTGSLPTVKELEKALKEVFKTISGGYMVLDAMDECSESFKVVKWLKNLPKQFCIFVTSRYRAAKIDEDIGVYLDQEMEKYSFKGALRNEVMKTLKRKAQGQFRWVDCQLKVLEECGTADTVHEVLADLPKDLEQTYEKAMERTMKKRTRDNAHLLLLWLLYSFQPVNIEKVEDILRVDLKNDDVKENNEMDANIHLLIDSTLVTVDTHSIVQVAHASVKEFLIAQYNSSHTAGLVEINELLAHEMIAQTCIIYLMKQIDIEKSRGSYYNSLRYYAVKNWPKHAKFVEAKDQSCLHLKILEFATSGILSFQKWLKDERFYNRERNQPPIFHLIFNGLLTAAQEMINFCSVSDLKAALYAAATYDHTTIADKILSCGVDINMEISRYGNALQVAVVKKRENMDDSSCTVLHVAVNVQNQAIVKLLLEKGANVNAQGGQNGTALQAAVTAGNEAILKLLLEKGANVNAQGGQYGTALQAAVAQNNAVIVNILFQKGVDVNVPGGFYGSALQAAAAQDNEAMVQFLLEKGADVNLQGGHYGNALQAAIPSGNQALVNLLLSQGADVNVSGSYYGSALQAAVGIGSETLVNILIKKGANVNGVGGYFGNALMAAIGGKYGTALQAAAANGNTALVNLLLENGADINAQGGKYGNAFEAAIANGNEALVDLLLEKIININAFA
ncbi:hypothetical protein GYMLUDRAFT_252394 [Collybiopsis luxurians FD-317 M1]|uniref:NACHT domain-containing protein n=1 Tax=Collybiopsis luxurians FD-317 M1 TaxID=944289 RepID=A0A0D0C8I5_9AGAR|nr:hypothetical protein GYMLUDRAFT_252394 [Collybiopsis luxurians FD-317 M1]